MSETLSAGSGPAATGARAPIVILDPETRSQILHRYPAAFSVNWRRRGPTLAIIAGALIVFVIGLYVLDISWSRVFAGFGRLGEFASLMIPPTYGDTTNTAEHPFNFIASLQDTETLAIYLVSLFQTLAIAFLGSLVAAILAFPFGFLAARNVLPNIFAHFAVRRFLDTVRSVDTLIWALIWINVVGLGPFAGILAIITSNFGIYGKLFSEALETADVKPVEGILSTGGTHWMGVRFGLLPQILPIFISQVLYQFESNTRSATIIGIVGAGGIGQHFYEQIKILEWQHVSFLVLLVLAAVMSIDFVSKRLRIAVIGSRTR